MKLIEAQILCFVLVCLVCPVAIGNVPLPVTLNQVSSQALEGPAHHGLVLQISPISDPNLTAYEVNLKLDKTGPFPWKVYSNTLVPFDVEQLIIPYRNGVLALNTSDKYCVRVRAVYGQTVTNWTQKCGITIQSFSNSGKDSDGDGISDDKEYALGADPNDGDSDKDLIPDNVEVDSQANPNLAYLPKLVVKPLSIDFGMGNPLGSLPGQHSYLEIKNMGEDSASLSSIIITNTNAAGIEPDFKIGNYPSLLTHIPPKNIVRIPLEFLPHSHGAANAILEVKSANNPVPVPLVYLKGYGLALPECKITPQKIDFGTVAVKDPSVSEKFITVSNVPPNNVPVTEVAPWAMTFVSKIDQIALPLQWITLQPNESFKVPVIFQHMHKGDFSGDIIVSSVVCGKQKIQVQAKAID